MTWGAPRGEAVGLISLYDFENNAIRQLAASLRQRGRRVIEVYFKDWQNNTIEPPSHHELTQLVQLLREQRVGLVGLSLRASAYQATAQQICQHLRSYLGVPLILGGWHVTVRPEDCMPFADALCLGEGDDALPVFVDRFFSPGGPERLHDSPGFWMRCEDGTINKADLPPLVTDLDALPWRDYTSADKWVLHRGATHRSDPMARDPLYQVMCSIGCIQKCSFCHNSFDTGAVGPRLRTRSVSSILDELADRRAANPAIRRVRFDDEIFGLDRRWLREFAERYPREVGLPFDILTEPTVVTDEYADLLRDAGARVVHMGLQSTESVNRDQLNRRANRATTRAAVDRLTARGMSIRYLVMVDIPNVTDEQQAELFEFLQTVPRPYDLYLFSLTFFPGTLMVEQQLQDGILQPHEIEGLATKTFHQYRADLAWPRTPEETFWLSLMVLQSSGLLPRRLLTPLAERSLGKQDPRLLVHTANAVTLLKTAQIAVRMAYNGEMTGTLVRRWWNPQRMVTM
ncbi:MAG: anaerobic magnesium-protoporphyrin IX monomethyl ester cyclase [Myxococcota bacterium]|jgi:anaerobic magnesium-protoporphyrin IX monomethyl ester cyclase